MRSSRFKKPVIGSLLLAAALAAGCSAQGGPPALSANGAASASALGAPSETSRIYRVGIGDKIKVTVFGETDLSGQFEIGATGALSMPLVGEIPAKGRSVAELRDAIAARLRTGYLRDPKVNVEITTYRPFYVHGEVRGGGEFAYKNGVSIRDAIAIAGGYTYRANESYVVLLREGSAQEVRVALPSTQAVMPGDNIRVPERFF